MELEDVLLKLLQLDALILIIWTMEFVSATALQPPMQTVKKEYANHAHQTVSHAWLTLSAMLVMLDMTLLMGSVLLQAQLVHQDNSDIMEFVMVHAH